MQNNTRERQQIILFSLIALIIPMLIFPRQFGAELARGSILNLLYEMVYYSIIIYLFERRGGLLQLVPAAGICLLYRLFISSAFGILIAAMYGMNIEVSLTLGVISYLPGILFQIIISPFIIKSVTARFFTTVGLQDKPISRSDTRYAFNSDKTLVASKSQAKINAYRQPVVDTSIPEVETIVTSTPHMTFKAEGFDRVVKYVGEHAAVKMCAIVDDEGLPLATFGRGELDIEAWTPMARSLLEINRTSLARFQKAYPDKLDMYLENYRVVVVHCDHLDLIVISELQLDDVLNIRINQAVDMIEKVVAERYLMVLGPELEKTDVRSAK